MNRYLFYIFATSLVLALITNDIEDHLQHHFGKGLTSGLDHSSYWYPDYTRKYDNNGQRKAFFHTGWRPIDYIMEKPAFFFDGWHLMKIFRQFLFGLCLFTWGYLWYEPAEGFKFKQRARMFYMGVGFMLWYGILVYVIHAIFYDGVFKW